eukprot:gene659-biopygen676
MFRVSAKLSSSPKFSRTTVMTRFKAIICPTIMNDGKKTTAHSDPHVSSPSHSVFRLTSFITSAHNSVVEIVYSVITALPMFSKLIHFVILPCLRTLPKSSTPVTPKFRYTTRRRSDKLNSEGRAKYSVVKSFCSPCARLMSLRMRQIRRIRNACTDSFPKNMPITLSVTSKKSKRFHGSSKYTRRQAYSFSSASTVKTATKKKFVFCWMPVSRSLWL